LAEHIRPGVTTRALDCLAEEFARQHKVTPTFKGYKGYPACLCTSVNEEIVHGIPSDRELREGDIVSVDFGLTCDGYVGDSARTFAVGRVSQTASKLIEVTREALGLAIEKARSGGYLSDIGHEVQRHAESNGFSVVRDFVGHGVGRRMHEEPQIPNYGRPGRGVRLREGMVLAIEPMINEGTFEVDVLEDGWTAVTRDRKLSAHFEHSIVILSDRTVVLSQA